jgi:hypothetical protein
MLSTVVFRNFTTFDAIWPEKFIYKPLLFDAFYNGEAAFKVLRSIITTR